MKKIKLLTGLSALSAIGIASLPLTSCNKFDGKVTEQEWKDAIAYICGLGKQDTYWSFKNGDYLSIDIKRSSDEQLLRVTDWITDPKGLFANATQELPTKTTNTSYDYYFGPFAYEFASDVEHAREHFFIGKNGPFIEIIEYFSWLYGFYNLFELKDDKCYHYAGTEGETISLNTKIGFSSDKKISSIESTTIIKDDEETQTLCVSVHLDYSKKDIQWPAKLTSRFPKHYFELSNSTKFNTSANKDENEGCLCKISPDKDGYKKLMAYDQSTILDMFSSSVTIFKNNEELRGADRDFTVIDGVIEFKESLLKTDSVYIKFYPKFDEKEYTFKLE